MASNEHWDWIETVSKIAGALGLNQVKVRWKLMAWRDSWKTTRHQAGVTAQHLGYAHRVCPHCGRIQDRSLKVCGDCGQPLSPRIWELLKRFGLVTPHPASVSSLLTAAILVCYVRTSLAGGTFDIITMNGDVLLNFGANYPPAVLEGQWWRLSTYIFLHMNLMHIFFNLIALQQIGPQIEEIFGKGRMLFFFMLTGIVAGAGSLFWGHYVLNFERYSIGASGSLMGLIGLTAGWGQREGTAFGRSVRDMMVKWGIYTVVFGLFIHADNAAHVAGFLCGGLLGLFSKPRMEKRSATIDWALTLVGAMLAIGSVYLVLVPPSQ
jgi:membrane associated rhomboid family serine protease